MSRLDTVRTATGRAKHRTKCARERFGGAATDVRGTASHYAGGANRRAGELRERVGPALGNARERIGPHIDAARENLGPRLEAAKVRMRDDVLPRVSQTVTDEVIPRVSNAWEASEPVREEAMARGGLALAALKGELSTPTVRTGRRRGRLVALFAVLAALGGACAFWRSQSRRQEWLLAEERDDQVRDEYSATVNATNEPAGPAGDLGWDGTPGRKNAADATPADGLYAPEPNAESDKDAGTGGKRKRGSGPSGSSASGS